MVFFSESKLRDWLLRNSRLQKPCHPMLGCARAWDLWLLKPSSRFLIRQVAAHRFHPNAQSSAGMTCAAGCWNDLGGWFAQWHKRLAST